MVKSTATQFVSCQAQATRLLMCTNTATSSSSLRIYLSLNWKTCLPYCMLHQVSKHLHWTFKKTSGKLKMLEKIRPSLTVYSAHVIYQSMIVSLMLYYDTAILELPESWLAKFCNLESWARKIILNGLNYDKTEFKMCDFGSTCIFNTYVLVFKSLNGLSCRPFKGLFQMTNHQQNTRTNCSSLVLPKLKL